MHHPASPTPTRSNILNTSVNYDILNNQCFKMSLKHHQHNCFYKCRFCYCWKHHVWHCLSHKIWTLKQLHQCSHCGTYWPSHQLYQEHCRHYCDDQMDISGSNLLKFKFDRDLDNIDKHLWCFLKKGFIRIRGTNIYFLPVQIST